MIKLLKPEEVSKLLRVPHRTVYKLANEGQIPSAFRVGKHWRFREDSILKWLEKETKQK